MELPKISCVVVTYNRKDYLYNCLNAIAKQNFKPSSVYIIDNASTDGTYEMLLNKHMVNTEFNGIIFYYIRLNENTGGAGGFYRGMKLAYENETPDALWVMDDDGCPEPDCLKELAFYFDKYDYIAPLVLPYGNDNYLSFNYYGEKDVKKVIKESSYNDIIENYACPFNAILYSSRLIKTIGYPNKDMFIWGDEIDYTLRAKKAGFQPMTIIRAIHRHPEDRMITKKFLWYPVIPIPLRWKAYFYYRNFTYNYIREQGFFSRFKFQIYQYFYLAIIKRNIKWIKTFNEAYRDGINADFSRTHIYKQLIGKKE